MSRLYRRSSYALRPPGAPDLPRDESVLTEQDFRTYAAALRRGGFFGPDSWYMNGARNIDYAREAANGGRIDLPVLFLCDTPGMMVGPEVEKTALVRHCCRLFVTGANLGVPFGTIVLRKAYGLGAQAMAGGSFHAGTFAISWPRASTCSV